MTTMLPKLKEESARDPFRPKFVVDDVARITKDDVNFTYKMVIYNYSRLPNNVPDHEKQGYEIVYSTEHIEDDRKFSPDNKKSEEESLRPAPVIKRTIDGYDMVLMRIPKELEKKNAKLRADLEDQRRKGLKVKRNKAGVPVDINDGEINLNNSDGETHNE